MKNLLISLATVCIATYCTYLLGEAETEDVQKATEKNGSNLEHANDANNEVNRVFEETMESEIDELGLSEEMKSRLMKRLREAPENQPMDAEQGREEAAESESNKSDAVPYHLEPFEKAKEELAELMEQAREKQKASLRKQLGKNFTRGERALREIYGKDATKDEIIEEIIKEWEKFHEETAKIPLDVKIGIAFQYVEELIPELVGISTTWNTTESTTLFFIVTTSLAKHYKVPDDKVAKLESVIERLIEVVPEKNQGLLEVETRHYTRVLMHQFRSVFEQMKKLDQDKVELMKIRDEVQSLNANAESKKIGRFVSCVDDMHRRVNKANLKVFTSLTRRLEKTEATVKKLVSRADTRERFRKIDRALLKSVVPLATNIHRVFRSEMSRQCYLEFDVDSLKDDYSTLLREHKEI